MSATGSSTFPRTIPAAPPTEGVARFDRSLKFEHLRLREIDQAADLAEAGLTPVTRRGRADVRRPAPVHVVAAVYPPLTA